MSERLHTYKNEMLEFRQAIEDQYYETAVSWMEQHEKQRQRKEAERICNEIQELKN